MKHLLTVGSVVITAVCFFSCRSTNTEQVKEYPVVGLASELEQLFRIDLLPQYRPGIVEQISSYDTTGGNDDGFSGRYSFIRKEGNELVLAELQGPGVINRIWTPTPTTDTVRFYFDGETVPRINIPFIDLFSGKVFPFVNPLCGNEVGGYYCYFPVPYNKSCKITYVGERIQFHQIQYRPYPEGTTVETFSENLTDNAKNILEKAQRFWSMQNASREETQPEMKEVSRHFSLMPGKTATFFSDNRGGRIVDIEMDCGNALEGSYKDILLKVLWDDDPTPAVYCPAADFFGYAFGKPAMKSLLLGSDNGIDYCRIPMPFRKKATLQLIYEKRTGVRQPDVEIKTKVRYLPIPQNPDTEGRLYTGWRRETNTEEGKPYLLAQAEGKGHYIGTIQQAQGLNPGMTLFFEGDDSTVIDNKMRMHGTGSEDYYNGGWYALLDRWDRGVSLPIHGSLDYSLPMARTGGYRFYLTDKMTFEENLLLTIEHGPEGNKIPTDYTSVAFYYGDRPSETQMQPNETLRTVFYPNQHVFFPQLMDISLGWNTTLEHGRRRLTASTEKEGLVRIMLNEIPEGHYKLFLSYFHTPDGGSFSVWNRQKMIADWQDAYAEKEAFKEKQELGTIDITKQTNSVSIRIRKTDKGSRFQFENLYLEKM